MFSFPPIRDLITSSTAHMPSLRAWAPFHGLLADGIDFLEEMPNICDANSVEMKQDAQ
jgi:hypothetical protein